MQEQKPYTISEFIEILNTKLLELDSSVIGEICELKISGKGHVYFTIKDKDTGDILPCTIWAYDYRLSGTELELGMEIQAKGCPNFYGPFGKLSFNAKSISLVGEGALKKAYEKLKEKLEKEGLMEESRKRPLPKFPKTIGVITSIKGAVIHDFSNNLRKSGFIIKIMDSRVEGPESGRDLTLAIKAFKKIPVDVLVLIRGGGSMQSLAGYDNEALVREIANFPAPVITGIGHHQDVPLAALVADKAESTPSLVAAALGKNWQEAQYNLEVASQSILNNFFNQLNKSSDLITETLKTAENYFESIHLEYKRCITGLKEFTSKISFSLKHKLQETKHNSERIINLFAEKLKLVLVTVEAQTKLIESNSPERQLKLGYSLAFRNGKVVKSIKALNTGQSLEIKLSDGTADTTVSSINRYLL